ncbi:MAG: septum formation initiator family protein [Candidatus Acidiferrales bacterium]|jgi:cell division protein FtsB
MSRHPTNEPPVSFPEQLRDFLRRNFNWFLAAGLALLLLQDVFGTHGVLAMRRSQKEASEVRKEIDQINEENRRLQERVKALKTDPEAIEHIAREEMGLARPGEYIFKIPPKPGEVFPSSSQPAGPPKKP